MFNIENGTFKTPYVLLKNLEKNKTLENITNYISDTKLLWKQNDISEFRFKYYSNTPHYEMITALRYVFLEDIGYFEIFDIDEKIEKGVKYKDVVCFSCDMEFTQTRPTSFEGIYPLYSADTEEESLLNKLLNDHTQWTLGSIDIELAQKYRYISVESKHWYEVIANICEIFECQFVFDYINYKINIIDINGVFEEKNLLLTSENYITSMNIETLSENIVTAIEVTSNGGEVGIANVNPSGDNIIYDFSYFVNKSQDLYNEGVLETDINENLWLTKDFVNNLKKYEDAYNDEQPRYSDILMRLRSEYDELDLLKLNAPSYTAKFTDNKVGNTIYIEPDLTLDSGLSNFEALRDTLESLKNTRIKNNLEYSDINSAINEVEYYIQLKNNEILVKISEIENNELELNKIRNKLQYENFLTDQQMKDLKNRLIRFGTFTTDSYVYTNSMTQSDKQVISQELFEYGQRMLSQQSRPTYKISLDVMNIYQIPEMKDYINELKLGTKITVKVDKDKYIKPILLGLEISLDKDKIDDFKLYYGSTSSVSINNEGFLFDGLYNGYRGGISYGLATNELNNLKKNDNWVSNFIQNGLDLATTEINNSDNTVQIHDTLGITVRNNETNGVVRITGDIIGFSNDNLQSCRLALGRMKNPTDGSEFYGIFAEVIGGNMLIGNQLHIATTHGQFTINDLGCFLKNMTLEVLHNNIGGDITNSIKIDPEIGIQVTRNGKKQFFLDLNTGDLYISGSIFADGTITASKMYTSYIESSEMKSSIINSSIINTSTMNAGDIFGTNINCNDKFIVNGNTGYVQITQGRLDIGNGNAVIRDNGSAYFKSLTIAGQKIGDTSTCNIEDSKLDNCNIEDSKLDNCNIEDSTLKDCNFIGDSVFKSITCPIYYQDLDKNTLMSLNNDKFGISVDGGKDNTFEIIGGIFGAVNIKSNNIALGQQGKGGYTYFYNDTVFYGGINVTDPKDNTIVGVVADRSKQQIALQSTSSPFATKGTQLEFRTATNEFVALADRDYMIQELSKINVRLNDLESSIVAFQAQYKNHVHQYVDDYWAGVTRSTTERPS